MKKYIFRNSSILLASFCWLLLMIWPEKNRLYGSPEVTSFQHSDMNGGVENKTGVWGWGIHTLIIFQGYQIWKWEIGQSISRNWPKLAISKLKNGHKLAKSILHCCLSFKLYRVFYSICDDKNDHLCPSCGANSILNYLKMVSVQICDFFCFLSSHFF